MDELRQDLRFGLRALVRRPGFAVMAIVMLALGVGINTAMFSVIRGVLLAPLPIPDAERVVRVHHVNPEGGADAGHFSPDDYEDVLGATGAFTSLGAFWHAPGVSDVTLSVAGAPSIVEAAFVNQAFHAALTVTPLLGRLPTDAEYAAGAVVLLTHRYWRTALRGDPAVVGSVVTVQGGPHTVLGVMPPDFAYPAAGVDVLLPLSKITEEAIPRLRHVRYLGAVGRLAPGVAVEGATAELTSIAATLAVAHPSSNEGWTSVRLQGVRDELIGSIRAPLLVLTAAVGLVLLIASANLMNLLLARATARGPEFAVRAALGAGRRRLARQLVTENVLLALIGGVLGVGMAVWLSAGLISMAGAEVPRADNVGVDGVVLLFALSLALLTGIGTAILPAVRAGIASAAALKDGGRAGTDGAARTRLRGALVAAEMTLAVLLLTGAGLMLRSLNELLRVDPGFRAEQVLAVSLRVPPNQAGSVAESMEYRRRLVEEIEAVPGIRQVAVAKSIPLEGGGEPYTFTISGRSDAAAAFRPEAGVMIVSPGYFEALGIPLRGEGLELDAPARRTMVINEAAARRYWPGENPVGQRVMLGDFAIEIVGIAGDVRHDGLHAPPTAVAYVSIDWFTRLSLRFIVRTNGDPRALVAPVRAAILALEPEQAIAEIAPLTTLLERASAREQFLGALLGAFALLALVLAALGIYGVVAYGVAQRLREIGIRMALGAGRGSVVRLIVLQSGVWWGAGLLLGLVLSLYAARLLDNILYGVAARDPLTFAAVALVLGGTALLASALPAIRASRVHPASTMR
jgi:predicted permease